MVGENLICSIFCERVRHDTLVAGLNEKKNTCQKMKMGFEVHIISCDQTKHTMGKRKHASSFASLEKSIRNQNEKACLRHLGVKFNLELRLDRKRMKSPGTFSQCAEQPWRFKSTIEDVVASTIVLCHPNAIPCLRNRNLSVCTAKTIWWVFIRNSSLWPSFGGGLQKLFTWQFRRKNVEMLLARL